MPGQPRERIIRRISGALSDWEWRFCTKVAAYLGNATPTECSIMRALLDRAIAAGLGAARRRPARRSCAISSLQFSPRSRRKLDF